MARALVVSCDCHAGATPEEYRGYLDPAYREGYDVAIANRAAYDRRLSELVGLRLANLDNGEWEREGDPGPLTSHWTAERRLRLLDADGIAAEVIFPQPGGLAGPPFYAFGHPVESASPELAAAGCRAYNRWLADFIAGSPEPERHVGLALVAVDDDVNAAVADVHWAREAGLRGVVLRSQPLGRSGWHDPHYERLWAVCEELAMPVHTHGGEGPEYGALPGSASIWVTEVRWFAHRLFWHLLWSGVLERHPKLQLVFAEQFAAWIPDLLHDLDEQYSGMVAGFTRVGGLSMLPSEYWARQGAVGASFMSRRECERRHAIGVGNIMWGSDFPHDEGTWPATVEALHATFDGVPEPELRAMLGENAARIYDLDVDVLASHVERVGPDLSTFANA